MNRISFLLIIAGVLLSLDVYVFQAVKTIFVNSNIGTRRIVYGIYWSYTIFSLGVLFFFALGGIEKLGSISRNFLISAVFINLIFKILMFIFLLLEDIFRLGKLAFDKVNVSNITSEGKDVSLINRSEFLSKTALVVASAPVIAFSYGIISGAHDYRVRRIRLPLANLPKSFHGIKIAQISDIHSGSFYNKTAVKGGIEMLLGEKPDIVFFTGDLVNNSADETAEYTSVFEKVKAPMGVYSTLGNHDYGDYISWASPEAKRKNLEDLKQVHKQMGWRLMMNEHIMLEQGGEKIALIGIENFGAKGHFPKYGKLEQAYKGTEDAPVKLLLSHDPSHWDYQVRTQYPDIDVMFAGHTHGMQFGIETKFLKWSPVQYMYKQWAGLYTEDKQHLYVNRGYGYLGYPGRIGILPEITILELVTA